MCAHLLAANTATLVWLIILLVATGAWLICSQAVKEVAQETQGLNATAMGTYNAALGLGATNTAAVSTFAQLFGTAFLTKVGWLRKAALRGGCARRLEGLRTVGQQLRVRLAQGPHPSCRRQLQHSCGAPPGRWTLPPPPQVNAATGGQFNFTSYAQLEAVANQSAATLGGAAVESYDSTVADPGVVAIVEPQFYSQTNATGLVRHGAGCGADQGVALSAGSVGSRAVFWASAAARLLHSTPGHRLP